MLLHIFFSGSSQCQRLKAAYSFGCNIDCLLAFNRRSSNMTSLSGALHSNVLHPGCEPQADGVTPCQRVGILYSPWHWPAYTAQQIIAAKGGTPLNMEMILNSRLELGKSKLVSVCTQHSLHGLACVTPSFPEHLPTSLPSAMNSDLPVAQ